MRTAVTPRQYWWKAITMRPPMSITAPRSQGSTALANRSSTMGVRSGSRIAMISVTTATNGPITRAKALVRTAASGLSWDIDLFSIDKPTDGLFIT